MKNNCFIKTGLMLLVTILFIFSSLTPMVIGYNVKNSYNQTKSDNYNIDKVLYSQYYDCYNVDEIPDFIKQPNNHVSKDDRGGESIIGISKEQIQPLDGPMNSPWPMYCHDTRHTGRSPYSTVDTWDEVWKFETEGWAAGGPTIDEEGIVYIGGYYLYAVYPDGTLEWKYHTIFSIVSAPAIDENGTIYFGIIYGEPNYLYAVYPNGTLKWKYSIGELNSIFSSPAIGNDGTIYFGSGGGYPPTGRITAVYPDGSLKWKFDTNHVVYSSPAIGDDGTVYCGSHDTYLYALHPNNGTLKWKFPTSNWIRTSPCIADDGTIYVVSLDSYLYALYPDGTLKWKTDVGAGTSPTIGQDGTIYAGYKTLYAVDPTDGSVKWTFDVGGTMEGGTPCNSVDDIIYVGTGDNGQIIAINPDGTERWRKGIGKYIDSPPAIGEDGTVYIGSSQTPGEGFLHAFGIGELEADANGPYYGLINEPVQFKGSHRGGVSPHSYHWTFGDGGTSDEQNPTHIYTNPGSYDVVLTVTDDEDDTASDTTYAWIQTSNTPPDKPTINGPINGKPGNSYPYTFTATDPDESIIWYYIDWGDNTNTGWLGPYDSGETITESHTWTSQGTFTIHAKAKDPYNEEGTEGIFEVTISRNRNVINSFFYRLLEQFPLLERLLNLL